MSLFNRLVARAPDEKQRGLFGPYGWPQAVSGPWGWGQPALQLTQSGKVERIPNDLVGYMQALLMSPPAFAAQLKRARYLSQAQFKWKNVGTGKLYGSTALQLVEHPWPNGTTGDLTGRMEWLEGLAGNAFAVLRQMRAGPQIKVPRPDWMTILLGSQSDAEDPSIQLDAEIVGFAYTPGGLGSGNKPVTLLPSDVAHWCPLPDPLSPFRGMSWITPLVRAIQGDIATAEHLLRYFENGATPNLVVKGIPAANGDEFKRLVELMDEEHSGVANAYKTLYLAAGADATVVGSDLSQIAFKDVQTAGENRIAYVGEVPAPLLGIAEGNKGSALNAGIYGDARRSFIDGWFASSLQSLAATLDGIVPSPADSVLALDPSAMPLLQDEETDAAAIRSADATTVRTLIDAGWEPDAVLDFVQTGDMSKLAGKHTGLFSVQLQPPSDGTAPPPTPPAGGPDA